jgi:DNA polymerase alpha subunit A
MADLLGYIDVNIPSRKPASRLSIKSESRRKNRVLSPPPEARPEKKMKVQETHDSMDFVSENDGFPMALDDDVPMSDPLPSSPVAKAVARKGEPLVKVEVEEEGDRSGQRLIDSRCRISQHVRFSSGTQAQEAHISDTRQLFSVSRPCQ